MVMNNEILTVEDCRYLNDITAVLYSEVIHSDNGETALKNFLESLKKLVPFEKGEIYFCNFHNDSVSYEDFIFCGWTKEELERYHNEDVYKMDEVLPMVSNSSPIIFRSSDVFIQSEREKTKYYNDVVRPLGMDYSIEGNISYEEGQLSAISIHRSERNSDFTPKALEVIKYIRPHLINISKIYNNLKKNSNIINTNPIPFDHMSNNGGFCIFDKDMKLIRSSITHLEEICGYEKEKIIDIITKALSLAANRLEDYPNITQDLCIGNHKFMADIKKSSDGYYVVIYDFSLTITNLLAEVKNKYNLSPREYDVFLCITEGLDTAEIADKLFISATAAKKHLINLYKKLNIKGRHQVLSIILNNDRQSEEL